MNRALHRCYRICGSQAAFARLVGVTGSALSRWNKRGVPPRRVPQIVAVMRGAVTYHELRPDMYPRPPKWCPTCTKPYSNCRCNDGAVVLIEAGHDQCFADCTQGDVKLGAT